MAATTTVTLYRLTDAADTLANIAASKKIVFNVAGTSVLHKDLKVENALVTKISRLPTEGIADNQGATQDLGDLQTLGKVEVAYVLECVITKRDGTGNDGQNTFLNRLKEWEDGEQRNEHWPEGRFGLEDMGNHNNDVAPVNTDGETHKGLLIEFIRSESDLAKNFEVVTIKLRESRGDGT